MTIAIGIFFWAVKSGQFEDLDTEAKRILFDESVLPKSKQESSETIKFSKKNGEEH